MALPVKLQLHYYLKDSNKHSINASLRNENERELLLIIREIAYQFDLKIEIESEALTEGGVRVEIPL